MLGFLKSILTKEAPAGRASAKDDLPSAVIRDIDQCLRLADLIGQRIATQVVSEFPFHKDQFGHGPAEAEFLGALVSNWLVFTTSQTLLGIGKHGGGPAASQFGEDLCASYHAKYIDAHECLGSELGFTFRPGDPFAEYRPCISDAHPITVVQAEDHLVLTILKQWYKEVPEPLEDQLRLFLRAAMLTYSERLAFDNPYKFFTKGGA